MRTRTIFLVISLVMCAGLAHAQSQEDNGYWWLKQDTPFKLGWIEGFVTGGETVKANALLICGINAAVYGNAVSGVCNVLGNKLFEPPRATYGQVIDGLDHFYSDYRNKLIKIDFAVSYVYDELSGSTQSALDQEVRQLREQAAHIPSDK
jgi:hypothetical protein